jgi:DNA polymerase (family 10)
MHQINKTISLKLREMADLLEAQAADGFRVSAYRRAADTVAALDRPIDEIARREGQEGLIALSGIGRGISSAILELLRSGRWSALERLTGEIEPEELFQTVPGIGTKLARLIHEDLQIDTLEELEMAAHDGRLSALPGLGDRRVAAIRAVLGERLGTRRVHSARAVNEGPDVGVLLDVDRAYREQAAAGMLRRIAPKRFNPGGEAWLPVFHTRRGDWYFTALFSNTEKAHALGRTHDWVVLYFHEDEGAERQCTVVTEHRGPLAGCRVVRGREQACVAYYRRLDDARAVSMPNDR